MRADELDSKLKSAKQNALRALRDKTDLLEDDGNVIRFGQHRFSVNTRPLELTIVGVEPPIMTTTPRAESYDTASMTRCKGPATPADSSEFWRLESKIGAA